MLQVHQVSKSYGVQTILDNITFSINPETGWGWLGRTAVENRLCCAS